MPLETQYIGDKVVTNTQEDGRFIIVTFDDNSTLRLSKKMFEASLSLEPLDPSTLRDRQLHPVVAGMIGYLLEWDVKTSDLEYISAKLITSVHEWTKAADEIKWGKEKREVTMAELDTVLRGNE